MSDYLELMELCTFIAFNHSLHFNTFSLYDSNIYPYMERINSVRLFSMELCTFIALAAAAALAAVFSSTSTNSLTACTSILSLSMIVIDNSV